MSSLLCALFAICMAASPAPAAPTWEETSVIAVPMVAKWEGLRTTAYLDRIASPPVWTICYGETEGVQPGETRTREECERGLRDGLKRYWAGFRSALTMPEILQPESDAAFTSLTWNIGIAAVKRSTAVKRLNKGDVAGACKAATWFNKSGGKLRRGLFNRRSYEYGVCMKGVA